jgi:hypothetical protein
MAFKSYMKESRDTDWGTTQSGNLTLEQIQAGAILRIADAVEKMAIRYTELIDERDRLQRWYKEKTAHNEKLEHQVRGLRGAITRMKGRKP